MRLRERYAKLGMTKDPAEVDVRRSLRINTLKIAEAECVQRLEERGVQLEKIDGLPAAYWFEAEFSLVSSIEYLMGYIYLQEAASMLPVAALLAGARPENVLDMCAAPGSKTTQLAMMLEDQVPIYALDVTNPRLQKLEFNLERLGITSVASFRKDARFAFDLERTFSHVLLDAPCSGNFCIEADFFEKRKPSDFKERARLQRELLRAAVAVLDDDGVLVYSTCSLEPEENELVIQWAIEELGLEVCLVELPFGEPGLTDVFGQQLDASIARTVRVWPGPTQGFFVAKLAKRF